LETGVDVTTAPPLCLAISAILRDETQHSKNISYSTAIALAGFSGAVAAYWKSHGHEDHVSPPCANSIRQGGL
jgi:hypothetical protein